MLQESAILHAGPNQPIQGRDGSHAPWMFYSWGMSLTCRGLQLAGRVLLEALGQFQSTQVATYGLTGMPLLCSCILQGEDRYTGLCVREERKRHGSMRRIDGEGDKGRPVVLLDDSLVSGTSMMKAIQALEEEGYQVEGALALMLFPGRGGLEFLRSHGYKIATVFDIWQDMGKSMGQWKPLYQYAVPATWGEAQVEPGLHPALAARRTAELYLQTGQAPRPPENLDQVYQAPGGTFVSLRDRHNDSRLVREGFWHFQPEDADAPRDLVLATLQALRRSPLPITPETLASVKFCATFFGPLEKIKPRQLDFSQYGIVARSTFQDTKMGGALPHTQVFLSEIEQYRHARSVNARIGLYEDHDLYRHSLEKYVEPGQYWLPFGSPEDPQDWSRQPALGEALTARARQCLLAVAGHQQPAGPALPDDLVPAPLYAVAVTLYHRGIVGCAVTWSASLDDCVLQATEAAWNDVRFSAQRGGVNPARLGISVSILHDREWHGETGLAYATGKLRKGLDSLSVSSGSQGAIFLPMVAVYFNWSKQQLGEQLLAKAGIEANAPALWATYPTATWLRRGRRVWRLSAGFPDRSQSPYGAERVLADIRLLAQYLLAHLGSDGLPEYAYYPVSGQRQAKGSAPRRVHALMALQWAGQTLAESNWVEAAGRGLRTCLEQVDATGRLRLEAEGPSAIGDAILLLAVSMAADESLRGEKFSAQVERVRSLLRPDGRVSEHVHGNSFAADNDFMPGAAILALCCALKGAPTQLGSQLEWHRRRFRLSHNWGLVGWQTQAWNAVHSFSGDAEAAEFVFELADYALDFQHEKQGFFIVELDPDGPSFHSGFLAEGMADAWALAERVGDRQRQAAYSHSCLAALRFLNRLIVRPEDTFVTAQPNLAVGGVRGALVRTDIRVDYVSHVLIALLKIFPRLAG